MTGRVIGIIGGSGLYQIDGLCRCRMAPGRKPVRPDLGRILFRHARRPARRVSAAARPRACIAALGDQFSRQYRRAEALRRHRHRLAVGGRQPARGFRARRFRRDRSVRRPHLRPREELFRTGLRRACLDGASGLRPDRRRARRRGRPPAGIAAEARRHLYRHGGAAILDPRRERALPRPGAAM